MRTPSDVLAAPTAVNVAPVTSGLVDQLVPDDERLPWIMLDEPVDDPDRPDDDILWSLAGAVDLRACALAPSHGL